MNDEFTALPDAPDAQPISAERVEQIVSERLDVEALAQMVEHLDYAGKLSAKLTNAFADVRTQIARQAQALGAAQQEIRTLVQDLALAKRALASMGQTGVLQRQRLERELVRELFPPSEPRPGAGVAVNTAPPGAPRQVDCEARLHVCKAACCRVLNVPLTPAEVDQGSYEWDPRLPYVLRRQGEGCVHLAAGTCVCSIYAKRPNGCRTYDCSGDARIWADFEKMELNPELAQRLESLHVDTTATFRGTAAAPPQAAGVRDARRENNAPPLPAAAPSAGASAPNFDELRALIVPKPAKPFVPPGRDGGAQGAAEERS